jgi:hypothetical protein
MLFGVSVERPTPFGGCITAALRPIALRESAKRWIAISPEIDDGIHSTKREIGVTKDSGNSFGERGRGVLWADQLRRIDHGQEGEVSSGGTGLDSKPGRLCETVRRVRD